MNFLHAAVLGIIQGLTEFIPVSSSGHLVLFQRIFAINDPSFFFDVMLHAGTLLAVFVVLWKDIWAIIKKPIQPVTAFLVLGTIPMVIFALIFRRPIEGLFSSGSFLGFSFLITSLLLCISEIFIRKTQKKPEKDSINTGALSWSSLSYKDAVIIGLFQAIAIIPGVSRSGATILGALSRKLDRDTAARFSFLLSIPAILGALVLHLAELFTGTASGSDISVNSGLSIIIGTIVSALVGFFAVRFMLKIIREKSLLIFAVYTFILGILVLIIF